MTNITVKEIDLTEYFDQLLTIWCACFPEDADFGENFLKNVAPKAIAYGVLQDNTLISCAYCLPATLDDGKTRFSSYYVYGVGTLPTYRGCGYAKELLQHIRKVMYTDVLYLYPAKPSLRVFYEKLGYHTVLYRKSQLSSQYNDLKAPVCSVQPFNAAVYEQARAAFLEKRNVLSATFDQTIMQTLLGHACLLCVDTIKAIAIVDEDVVYVPEVLCEAKDVSTFFAAIQRHFCDKKIVVYTDGEDEESGMVLSCSTAAEQYFSKQEKIPFFGTFFAE